VRVRTLRLLKYDTERMFHHEDAGTCSLWCCWLSAAAVREPVGFLLFFGSSSIWLQLEA
jgi:hypothetical protein